jgi:hypothetical protein
MQPSYLIVIAADGTGVLARLYLRTSERGPLALFGVIRGSDAPRQAARLARWITGSKARDLDDDRGLAE